MSKRDEREEGKWAIGMNGYEGKRERGKRGKRENGKEERRKGMKGRWSRKWKGRGKEGKWVIGKE